ncbi:universal stress protein [Actinoplanes derwentensis]|uniref:Nucleotide-binding universal stress protein, UspA family n=1 Tax=Actinoplanes derwentensis TaxID=113562 RepID=A0A1H2B6N6_9ACTN|nr:universal stress protein [Actinoplanes derwentensis]GID86415.1 universal stress protein [Actinoplanes derwentensis]SDT53851.1 Nucleotide-binding universal stress protein, UspA family [Actinoplanes derwentensis]
MNSIVPVQEKLPVVVGVDGTSAALHAVDLAAAEAAHRRVPLVVAHAWPGRHFEAPKSRVTVSGRTEGVRLLDLAARRARHTEPHLTVVPALMDEGAAEALLRWSARASLLVVGHRDDTSAHHGWGSTAAYLAHHSACPLLVSRGRVPSRGPVIVAVSGGPGTTLARAYEAAAYTGGTLTAVHVWKPEHGPAGRDADRTAGENLLDAALNACGSIRPSVPVTRLLISEAEIAYTVERAAWRGRLLVAGMGHKGWAVEALYRSGGVTSTGRRLCPVLLVPAVARSRTSDRGRGRGDSTGGAPLLVARERHLR